MSADEKTWLTDLRELRNDLSSAFDALHRLRTATKARIGVDVDPELGLLFTQLHVLLDRSSSRSDALIERLSMSGHLELKSVTRYTPPTMPPLETEAAADLRKAVDALDLAFTNADSQQRQASVTVAVGKVQAQSAVLIADAFRMAVESMNFNTKILAKTVHDASNARAASDMARWTKVIGVACIVLAICAFAIVVYIFRPLPLME